MGKGEGGRMGETARRLIQLLRILERDPVLFGALGDDALLDAWFGIRSPLFPTEGLAL
jgi:hypothetical protein